MRTDDMPKGRPLRLDPEALSASPAAPAFIARPAGAPVYYGFPILDDVEVEGFKFGMITDFEAQPDTDGDAFVVAPDGSRAGLVWKVTDAAYFETVCPPSTERWGVWAVAFAEPMTTRDAVRRNLRAVLPQLKREWLAWRRR